MDDKLKARLNRHYERQNSPEFKDLETQRNRSRIISEINSAIAKNPRVVVSLGCSFAHGQASYDQEMVDFLRPQGGRMSDFDYRCKEHSLTDLLDLAEHYKFEVREDTSNTDWRNESSGSFEVITHPIEVQNAYVNKVAEILDYVPVNLGNLGNGNNSSANRLFSYPIDWHLCEDIIVLWSYTDLNRYDVINDGDLDFTYVGNDFKTMWPMAQHYDRNKEKYRQGEVWHNTQYYFTQTIWSELFNYINFVDTGIKISTWCKAHGAKLITFGAFDDLQRSHLEDLYTRNLVHRDSEHLMDLELTYENNAERSTSTTEANLKALDKFPWHSVFYPGGERSFLHLCASQEPTKYDSIHTMADVIEQGGTPNDWIFPCGHPSGKGHELLAQLIVKQADS